MDIQITLLKLVDLDLTQAYIASEIGCSQPNVSDMVRGKVGRQRPGYEMVKAITKLAEKHGVSVDDKPVKPAKKARK